MPSTQLPSVRIVGVRFAPIAFNLHPRLESRGDRSEGAELIPGSGITIRRFEAARSNPWHHAPGRAAVFTLSGAVDIEIGDGTVRRLEPADGDSAAGNQLGALGAVTSRFEPRMDLLEVRLAVGSRVDANDGHVISDLVVSSGPREQPRLDRHPLPLAYSHCATSASVSPPNASREPSDSMVPVRITYT